MKRPRLLTMLCVVSLIISAGGFDTHQADAAITTLPVILLAQDDTFVTSGNGCSFDAGDGDEAILRIVNREGQQTGGFALSEGEVINADGPSKIRQTYCAFAKSVDPGATGVVRLEINDNFLMSLDVDTFNPYRHLVLEVDSQRLVALDYATEPEVLALGLEPLDLTVVDGSQPASTETVIASTPRANSTQATPETVALPPDALVPLDNAREKLRETSPHSGIVTGEWSLEEPPMLNFLIVSIQDDLVGDGLSSLQSFSVEQIAELVGFPVLSEDTAPAGCRAFTIQGPYQVVMYVGMCADGDYLLGVMATDQQMVHLVMRDFLDGKPFAIPPGYDEAPEFRRPDMQAEA